MPQRSDELTKIQEESVIEIGGVTRPTTDVLKKNFVSVDSDSNINEQSYRFGKTPMLAPDINPSVRNTFESLVAEESSDSVNPLLTPPPFNRSEYEADPSAYLSQSVPGRVWQTGQPADGVDPIARIGDRLHEMKQGESLRLQVQSSPNLPVTFTSFDLGAFQNQLTSVTVQADEDGVAEAVFTATSGTIANVNILAASPAASGTARFVVHVSESIQ